MLLVEISLCREGESLAALVRFFGLNLAFFPNLRDLRFVVYVICLVTT
jgi:hypothetical protein